MKIRQYVIMLAVAVALAAPALPQPGGADDKGGSNPSGSTQPADDKGGAKPSGATQPGDDKGGLNPGGSTQPGDDKGGLSASGSTQPGDDKGGASGNSNSGRNGADDKAGDDHSSSDPGIAVTPTDRLIVPMATGSVGAVIQASGNVDVRVQGSRQRLKVELEAQVPDGIMFRVFANGVELDVIRSVRGHAELEIEVEDGKMMPGGLTPSTVNSVRITDVNKMPVLEAQFGSRDSLASAPAASQNRSRVEMTATAAGTTLSAHGDAEVRTQGSQRLRVQVEANAPDGTELRVFANGIEVGTAKVRFGHAELELEDGAPLPAGIDSVMAIKAVKVTTLKGDSLLEAKF